MANTFEGLLALLTSANVKFMLVGGLAVSINGFVRTTEDMDILVEDSAQNLGNLLEVLAEFGRGYGRELSVSDFTDEEGAIRVQEDFDLDIFTRMRTNRYRDLERFLRYHPIEGGIQVPYMDAEGLVLLKQGSAREKDRIDAAVLNGIVHGRKTESKAVETPRLDSLGPSAPGSS